MGNGAVSGLRLPPSTSSPVVFVAILNWNSWRYTLRCLESVLRSDFERLRVIVCDNGSTDESWQSMLAWAAGEVKPPMPTESRLAALISSAQRRDVNISFVQADAARYSLEVQNADVIFLRRASNDGYAAGNNAAMNLSLALGADYVWILNNDTLVEPSAARRLVDYMKGQPGIGMCGTTIMEYDNPHQIQVLAGWNFDKWLARPRPTLAPFDARKRLSYVAGSSLFVSRKFLLEVGLLCEQYFLYCEELDWIQRANNRFSLGYCEDAVVYHKGGASVQTLPGAFGEYCSVRAGLLLTRKFWPLRLLTVLPAMLAWAFLRFIRGRWRGALVIICAVLTELGYRQENLESRLGLPKLALETLNQCRSRESLDTRSSDALSWSAQQ